MELNEHQFDGVAPKKWLTDVEYYKRFNEERDEKQDYNEEDEAAHKQHVDQWRLMMPLRSHSRAYYKGDKTSIDKGMDLFKDYNPTKESIVDLLRFARDSGGDELIHRMDMHFGTK